MIAAEVLLILLLVLLNGFFALAEMALVSATKKGEADANVSGRQELIENILNRYIR